MGRTLHRQDLLYPELSYKVMGCAFDVFNALGSGHHEKYYQRALIEAFKHEDIKYQTEVSFPIPKLTLIKFSSILG